MLFTAPPGRESEDPDTLQLTLKWEWFSVMATGEKQQESPPGGCLLDAAGSSLAGRAMPAWHFIYWHDIAV